jgi:putative endonuclease
MTHRRQLGQDGEAAATAHLERLGWSIIARNWRPAGSNLRGEVDIIAGDAETLVFCEVKTRSGGGAGDPLEAVTPIKVRRLRLLAGAWLAGHHQPYREVRFDVIGVHWPPAAVAPSIDHLRDAVR